MNNLLISKLACFNLNVMFAHWEAPAASTERKTLGELNEELGPLIDTLAHVNIAKTGVRKFSEEPMERKVMPLSDLIAGGIAVVQECLAGVGAEPLKNNDLISTLGEIEAAINHAKDYLNV